MQYRMTIFSSGGWDKQNVEQSYENLNSGKELFNLRKKAKLIIDINDDPTFKSTNKYFKKQIPPDENETNWTDPVFPPDSNSLMYLNENNQDVTKEELDELKDLKWRRAKEFFLRGRYELYDTFSMDDVEQGSLGNCYFLSVLSELANRPEIYDNIFITKSKSKNNCYLVKVFIRGIPKIVCVDDFFPSNPNKTFAFALSGEGEIWVQTLEKVWAKINSSYAMTIAGIPSESFCCLSEAPCVTYIHKKYSEDELWAILKKAKTMGYYLATNTRMNKNAEKYGLVEGHAYSLTNLHEFELPRKEGQKTVSQLRLVQLRNPWGNFEWTGDFSDNSSSWNVIPGLKEKLEIVSKDDGIFHMKFSDFLSFFPYSFILKYHKNFHYNYKILEQQSIDHNSCAKFILEEPAVVKIGLHLKQQRFYSKVKNYVVPPGRIIIGKYDRDTKKYQFIGSQFETTEVLYAETARKLEPGEYHIFLNTNWPYSTKITYTLTTYSSIPIEILELSKNEIPVNYLEQILIDYLDSKVEKKILSPDTDLQISDKENHLGFYMALLTNNSDKPFKFSTTLQYSNLTFLEDDLVAKRARNTEQNLITDSVVGILPPRKRKLFVWKLLQDAYKCKINIIEKKLYAFVPTEEEKQEKEYETLNIVYGSLNKKRLNEDILYTEVKCHDHLLLVFKNGGRSTYKFEMNFSKLENLGSNNGIFNNTITLALLSDRMNTLRLDITDTSKPFTFTFTYSFKKLK